MLAAWYEKKGKAKEVYNISRLKDPEPKPNEVRVRLYASGVNHTDCKRRSGHGNEDWNYAHHFPDFPIIIPNNGLMDYDILEKEFIDFQNIKIAPSKGNLIRNTDPQSVNYNFDDIYMQNQFYSILHIF